MRPIILLRGHNRPPYASLADAMRALRAKEEGADESQALEKILAEGDAIDWGDCISSAPSDEASLLLAGALVQAARSSDAEAADDAAECIEMLIQFTDLPEAIAQMFDEIVKAEDA